MNEEIHLNVNDYLDLYLFAKKAGDPIWQEEIIEKLKNKSNRSPTQHSLDTEALWKKLKQINKEIGSLCQQLQSNSSNTDLEEMLQTLKQQRYLLNKQINYAKRNSF